MLFKDSGLNEKLGVFIHIGMETVQFSMKFRRRRITLKKARRTRRKFEIKGKAGRNPALLSWTCGKSYDVGVFFWRFPVSRMEVVHVGLHGRLFDFCPRETQFFPLKNIQKQKNISASEHRKVHCY